MSRALLLILLVCLPAFTQAAPIADLVGLPTKYHQTIAIFRPMPKYPYEARAHHITGAGICVLYIRPDGSVRRAEMMASTGHAILDNAALEAFRRWRFRSGTVKKVKIPVRYTMKGANY